MNLHPFLVRVKSLDQITFSRTSTMEVKNLGEKGDEEWVEMREKMEDRVEIEGEGARMGRIWEKFHCGNVCS